MASAWALDHGRGANAPGLERVCCPGQVGLEDAGGLRMWVPTGNLQHTEAGFSFALVYPPKMTVKGLAWH